MVPFWHQKSTTFHPNIDPKRHQKNDRVWDRFFWPSWLQFGSQLGTMLAPFSPKVGRCCGMLPSSVLRCLFSKFFAVLTHLRTILARFRRLWTPSGRVVGPIFANLPSWRPLGALGRKKGPGWNEIFLPGPAECAKRSAAQRGRRARWFDPGLLVFPDSSKAKFLTSISGFPLPNPLQEAAHSAGPTQSLCRQKTT